ncbi:hypothetical protein OIU84_004438 [Salix udensis]|uniref:Beta-amylase n=1 Tax=Salix udensis TaxID=889485 RepID=A0AAD6K2I2_9ROSI|nr:hypothetical protein OIU84_004438 [Salix udensis]
MTITLRSSSSFISLNEIRSLKITPPDGFSGTVRFAQIKPSCRLQAKINSEQEAQLSHDDILVAEGRASQTWEKLHAISSPHGGDAGSRVPVFVMLPLDTVTIGGSLNKPRAMNASLMALRSAGVEGVMVDAWWGLVEKDGPFKYNWEGYAELVQMVQKHGLKLQVVMSFHQCGGNVGDSCSIPLPPWVLEEMSNNHDLVYTDKSGRRNPEFKDYLGEVITEIQVGLGPCGELRYPAYPESNGTWKFPGIGEFQCYDKYMRASLEASAEAIGKADWGRSGPHDSGHGTQGKLLEHGDKILAAAEGIYRGTGAKLSGKVAGIHWHYRTRSHAAELTSGYYNTRHHDGYLPIAQMFSKYGVVFNFTCMEMRDGEQPVHANCSPEGLVRQVKMATRTARTGLAGENALERYDAGAYSQVMATNRSESGNRLTAFTYLRMNKRLFEGNNWLHLVEFVKSMSEGGRDGKLSECVSCGTGLYIGFIKDKGVQKTREAALV